MRSPDLPATRTELFQALADPRRRLILDVLVAGPLEVGELSRRCRLPRPLVVHHLGVLSRAGLVQLHRRQACVRAEGLESVRRYVDAALTLAAISALSL